MANGVGIYGGANNSATDNCIPNNQKSKLNIKIEGLIKGENSNGKDRREGGGKQGRGEGERMAMKRER
jgi:hypothetical protein